MVPELERVAAPPPWKVPEEGEALWNPPAEAGPDERWYEDPAEGDVTLLRKPSDEAEVDARG